MLGVHFAITADQEQALLAAADGDGDGDGGTVESLVGDLEETWEHAGLKVDTDKAWDAIHRCLTDGTLDADAGTYPLSHAVLGGRELGDDMWVSLVTAAQVRDVAAALHGVDEAAMRVRFDAIDDPDHLGTGDDEDFAYTWSNFTDLRAFFDRAAAVGRAVIFTAS